MRTWKALGMLVLVIVAAAAFWAGRATAGGPPRPADPGYEAGHADGLREGRAEQAVLNLPASDKAVFDAGYVAGATDVFADYDGGWDRGVPYAVVLGPGRAGVTYRVVSRTPLTPGVDYYLCPDGKTLCQRPH